MGKSPLLTLGGAVAKDPAIATWMQDHSGEHGSIAWRWFEVMRGRGKDVRELLHDGNPVVCVADAPFCYVGAYKAHASVGFFRGSELPDPAGLLEGNGKLMRHVKIRRESPVDEAALSRLIDEAYANIRRHLSKGKP
jgi:hypothetical protein